MFSIILYMTNPKSSVYYNNKINELNAQYLLVIKEIKKCFPLSKTYPNITKYIETYNNNLSEENHIKSKLYILKNELQNDIENTKNDEQKQINKINNLENKNSELKNKINQLKNKNAGAIGFYHDFKNKYNVEINKIIIFFIITLIMIIYLFTDKNKNEPISEVIDIMYYTTTPVVKVVFNELESIMSYIKGKLFNGITYVAPC